MSARVLIVDDEPNIVTSLEFLMARAGYEVAVVSDGETALEALDTFRPDLVILDLMLPHMDGVTVCQRLRERREGSDAKVLMLTAKGRDVEVAKGLDAGADAYVTKPFSTRALVAQVATLLGDRA